MQSECNTVSLPPNRSLFDAPSKPLQVSLLSEAIQNLQRDINHMKTNILIYENAISSATIVLDVFEKQLSDQDSINKYFSSIAIAPKFLPTRSAYQSMNQEGLRIIKNDSLRNMIITLYEEHYSFFDSFCRSGMGK